MSIITFNLKDVEKLVEQALSATSYSPTMDMLFEKSYYPNKVILNDQGKSEKEVISEGGHFWPSHKYIDKSLIKPVLQLVGDEGCYLMTNVDSTKTPTESGMLVYADGIVIPPF